MQGAFGDQGALPPGPPLGPEAPDPHSLLEAIQHAYHNNTPLEIIGGGTKRPLGRPPIGAPLSLERLTGIQEYDPPELVLTARAATPLAEIEAALAAHNQMLAFEPPDWRALLGTAGEATLGGAIACNAAGPRRIRAGAARDHILGFAAIDGTGTPWNAGGRVVKNVSGYDMAKLQAGAMGTLSVLTEITVRVLPRPETETTLLVAAPDAASAVAAMTAAIQSPHEVAGAAWLPARGQVALRLEGHAPSVAWRAAQIPHDARLDGPESAALWRNIASVAPLLPCTDRVVWRLCPPPAAAAQVLEAIAAWHADARMLVDWSGGLIWLSLPPDHTGSPRDCLTHVGGHATLMVAPSAVRETTAVFERAAPGLAALQARIRRQYDPKLILNRGRLVPE